MNSFTFIWNFFVMATFAQGPGLQVQVWYKGKVPLDFNEKGLVCQGHTQGSSVYGITAETKFPDNPNHPEWCRFFWTCPKNGSAGSAGIRHGCTPYTVYDPSHESCVAYTSWFNEPVEQLHRNNQGNKFSYFESVGHCFREAMRRDFFLQRLVRTKRSELDQETDREDTPVRKVRKSSPTPSKPMQQKFIEPIDIEPEEVKEVVNIKDDPVMASTSAVNIDEAGQDFDGDEYDGYNEDDGAEMGDGDEGTSFDDASEDHILTRIEATSATPSAFLAAPTAATMATTEPTHTATLEAPPTTGGDEPNWDHWDPNVGPM